MDNSQQHLNQAEIRKMGEEPEQIKQFPNKIIDFEYVEKEIENEQGEKVIKIERIEDKSVKEHQIKNDLLNRQLDSKLQFAGMAGVIRNITVSNPAVEKDFKFQDDLFKKEFYNNLGQIMSFYNQNKGYLTKIEFKKQTEKNEVKVEIKDKKNILEESKIIALKQKIKEKIPQIKADTIINYIMKDFILLYFCDMELYEDTLEKFVYYPQAQISQEIQFLNLINMELKSEKGFYKFLDCLTQDFQLPNEDFMKTKKQDNLEKTLRKLGEKVDAKNQVVLKKIKSIAGHQQLLEIQLEDTKDDSMSTSQLSQISHKKRGKETQ
ncbi:hypothetical protein PPERSA_07649 [Pseudocohnilembus persalinus]|uniref:Uncharacterized protein n=1 Tax=Pseudocohnilembus persalinus TaxID=266149 RepID=A0A0V0QIF7_PSEPJ|nr:hypothetical protein PPERSA_07649 [Pseudocohnilembus persalinus]|eukprot:KRX02004.1 hypothetical protein PPERSA_07649 [Pseudocohnilembus persalinus]